MPRLSEAERNKSVGRLEAGESFSAVAIVFNVAPSTLMRLWNRYQHQGTTRDRPRSGRPIVTTRGQDRYIRLRHLRNLTTTASSTASNIPGLRRISAQTHDNARPHAARHTTAYLQANNVQVVPWPSKSPDLNPIEHLWDELDRRVRQRQQQPQTLEQLAQALQEEWANIPQRVIQTLVGSMGRRCKAVLDANGGHTRY
ncbi:uncharacterized protein LOC124266660 [Haliotis rubra]|uniref:uncharacterized protein LOC124266660 n=1 Tax=Haliotis rubra TaxID=36100 RepID=UPI001EE5468E|nr:uncharacterized protein LOC124266660 [Haliotis rubra]